ncbi:MAG: hypothetical protein ABMA15_03435 [Vicinamibacterales bacterium]
MLLDTLHGPDFDTEQQPNLQRPSTQQWSAYPTRTLRARLVCEAVKQLPDESGTNVFVARASDLLALWRQTYPEPHAMTDFEEDIPKVVRAIFTTPLAAFAEGAPKTPNPLTDVFTFTAEMQEKAVAEATRALDRGTLIETDDRVLVAAAALAFVQDPSGALAVDTGKRFRDRLLATRSEEVRDGAAVPERETASETPAQIQARHQSVAQALRQRLSVPRRA